MTDIAATLDLAVRDEYDEAISLRGRLFAGYEKGLPQVNGVRIIGSGYEGGLRAAMCEISVGRHTDLQRKLKDHGIELNQVHYRNDRYKLLGSRRGDRRSIDAMRISRCIQKLTTGTGRAFARSLDPVGETFY